MRIEISVKIFNGFIASSTINIDICGAYAS